MVSIVNLKKEERLVIEILNELGCISMGQIKEIYKDSHISYLFLRNVLINSGGYFLVDKEKYFKKKNVEDIDYDAIDCLWVLLNIIKKEEKNPLLCKTFMIKNIMGSDTVAKISYVESDKNTLGYIIKINKDNIRDITLIQDNLYSISGYTRGKDPVHRKIIYVIEDESLLEYFEDLKLDYTFEVALINKNNLSEYGNPETEFYSLEN